MNPPPNSEHLPNDLAQNAGRYHRLIFECLEKTCWSSLAFWVTRSKLPPPCIGTFCTQGPVIWLLAFPGIWFITCNGGFATPIPSLWGPQPYTGIGGTIPGWGPTLPPLEFNDVTMVAVQHPLLVKKSFLGSENSELLLGSQDQVAQCF